jgi:hypothetical protein
MAGRIYSTLFVGAIMSAGGVDLGFTPDVDQVAVVRDIELFDFDALPGDEIAFRFLPSGGDFKLWTVTDAGSQMVSWQGRIVVPSGFGFLMHVDTGTWRVLVSGYVLSTT